LLAVPASAHPADHLSGYLRVNVGVPQPIVDFWSGHKSGKISDVYTRMATLTKERREWANKVGIGYKLAGPKVVKEGKAA